MSNTTDFPETLLMYYSVKGTINAPKAFEKLESALPTLRGRKFYGYYYPETEEYRACVEVIPSDPEPETLGFKKWKVPGGKYLYEKIMDWQKKKSTIATVVDMLIKENKTRMDWSRPILEYYRGLNELRVMVPIMK